MTDVEKFRALMADFGVPLDELNGPDWITLTMTPAAANDTRSRVQGYPMFETVWTFGFDGKFMTVGLWE